MIQLAKTDKEIMDCFETLKELRAGITSPSQSYALFEKGHDLTPSSFLNLMHELMVGEYRLAYRKVNDEVACIAGFRVSKNLAIGKHLYLDDLVTKESHRSQGFGDEMMNWLRNYAVEESCKAFHLDSGVWRHGAHKFYLNQGMDIVSYHLLQKL
jgi:GNAT superfamily N-acetyltransferase